MSVTALAVFCGSQFGTNALFAEHAMRIGKIMAENNIRLIYGGGNVGLMGALADSVMQNGGRVTGIIPKVLVEWERQHTSITELIIAEDMHERKRKMYELCDAALVLPGGFGTLDELFEMLTWNQLSIHEKEIYIMNSAGFYDHLLEHIKTMQNEKFLYEIAHKRIHVLDEPEQILSWLNED